MWLLFEDLRGQDGGTDSVHPMVVECPLDVRRPNLVSGNKEVNNNE